MVRKKIDNRIRTLIENGIHAGHRSMFVMVGDKGRDQIVILHHMLSKAAVKARPNVLWCYKSDLGFSSHRKKKMRQFQKKIASGKVDVNEDDPFELFVASTNIRYCYYSETHKILGQTFGMCVLQDFEAITPNLLARTMETVEGGGLIIILLRTVDSLKQLYTMNMDIHARFRTEAHQNVVCRFNERFILSLSTIENCMVLDDSLHVLPISSHIVGLTPTVADKMASQEIELNNLKDSLKETQPVGVLINCCKTLDQAKAVLKFIDAISEKQLNATVTLTAARGRGKSAALGLSIAAAIAFGYSNVYVTSPSPENLKTLFEFVFKGFDVLEYVHHEDYDYIQSTNPEFNKAVERVNFFRDHRQTIQYIDPHDAQKLGPAELLIIDEAAAIPLPLVKSLFGPYLIFLSSTISGYEGTGRSLSLKLIQQLRSQSNNSIEPNDSKGASKVSARVLKEVTLEESIRYKPGDGIEKWLINLLCLDATVSPLHQIRCPAPKDCELYHINRDALFSGHAVSEQFLKQIMSLYVSSHYKNSPNDLQLLSDAPAHILMCLMGPTDPNRKAVPEVLVVLQICLEGEISKKSISTGLALGKRASGDLIPWTVAQQFQDQDFPSMSGARIVRIATHPDYQGMGYGSRVVQLLKKYYELKMDFVDNPINIPESTAESVPEEELNLLTERIAPKKILPPLLCPLSEREPELLQYLGVSFGVTLELLKFWKRASFVPVYMRQTSNDLTGEHTCIMLTVLENSSNSTTWLQDYFKDFQRRFISLLSFQFRVYSPALAISILQNKISTVEISPDISASELNIHITPYDIKRLELYTKNMADYHLVMDLIPTLSRLYFLGKLGSVRMSAVQTAILLGMGLQHKTVDELSTILGLAGTQLLGLFNRTIRKMLEYMNGILEKDLASQLPTYGNEKAAAMLPVAESLAQELDIAANDLKKKQTKELSKLKKDNLSQYAIKGSDEAWSSALQTATPKLSVSVKIGEKRLVGQEKEGAEKKRKGEGGKGWKRSNSRQQHRPNKPPKPKAS